MPESLEDFGKRLKTKYPEYSDIPDADLAQKILTKHPEYSDMIDASAVKPATPGLEDSFNMGVAEKDLPPGAGVMNNLAHFAGNNALPIAGAIMGAPAGIPGIALGAAGGKVWQKDVARVMVPEYAKDESLAQTVGGAAKEGLSYAAGEGVMRGLGALAAGIGKNVIPPVVGTITGAGRRAVEALINDTKGVMKYVGIKPEDVAAGAQDLQSVIQSGKGAIEEGYKRILGKHHEELLSAAQQAAEAAQAHSSNANTIGKQLQDKIPQIYKQASKDYSSAMESIIGQNSKYTLDPGAAYPYTINLAKETKSTIGALRKEYGFDQPDLPGDMATAAKTYNWFADKISKMSAASVDEAYNLQKQLTHYIEAQRGATGQLSPLGSALRNLKSKVMGVFDEAIPEMRPMNKAYAEKMALADNLSQDAGADSIANRIKSHTKIQGNTWDAWKTFAAQDPEAAKLLEGVIHNHAQAADLVTRAKETQKLADVFGNLKATYQLGKGKDTLIQLAEKDPVMADILKHSSSQESTYSRLSSILGSDNPAASIERIMSEGGNRADALKELADKSPMVRDMIQEVQRKVYGEKFTPWMRSLPQTGFAAGVGHFVSGGPIPMLAGAAAVSPRVAAGYIAGGKKLAGAVGTALAGPAETSLQAPASAALRGAMPSARMPVAGQIGAGLQDLGEMSGIFNSPEEVKAAHERGEISPEQAVQTLTSQWPQVFE